MGRVCRFVDARALESGISQGLSNQRRTGRDGDLKPNLGSSALVGGARPSF